MIRSARLTDYVDDYSLARGLKSATIYQIGRGLALFAEHLERPPTLQDLDERTVGEWLRALEATHAAATVVVHRTNLLTIWRFIADENDGINQPGRVRRVARPDPCPIAWTLDELRDLARACGTVTGTFAGDVPRSLYFSTLLKSAYETGLRRSDLWTIERSQIRSDGSVVLRQKKTGRAHCPRVLPDTLTAIDAMHGRYPLAWPLKSPSHFYQVWKRIVADAGVRPGALQQIRRTGATHLSIEHPNAVQRYLGHRTESMKRHYFDESIARPQQFLPPPIATIATGGFPRK